jgi:ABC-2 type transport system permease protein
MTAYLSVFSARFRAQLQYRAAAVAGFGTQLFWGLIRVMIFQAFYASSARTQPMRLDETITYIWLGQALFALLPFNPDADVRQMIRTGTIAYEIARPVDLYTFWLCRAMADRLAPALLRAVPMFAVAIPFLGLSAPHDASCALAWVAATAGAVLMASALAALMTISLLWTTAGDGIARLAPSMIFLLSGMVLPLVFFPPAMQPLLNALPFRDIIDTPFRIYMGHIPKFEWGGILAHEVVWIVALIALGRGLLARGMSRIAVQGG